MLSTLVGLLVVNVPLLLLPSSWQECTIVKGKPQVLGEDWWLLSPKAAGKFQRCGLHTVIESLSPHRYICVWEPREPALVECVLGSNPQCPNI